MSDKAKNIPLFGKTDIDNLCYRELIKVLEPLEGSGLLQRNAHHLTQNICSNLGPAITEKITKINKGEIKWIEKEEE